MKCSEITLREAIEYVDKFCPVKIVFNGIILYNDYDDEEDTYGVNKPFMDVISDRLWQFDKYIVTSINIEIIELHHSVVTIQGEYKSVE